MKARLLTILVLCLLAASAARAQTMEIPPPVAGTTEYRTQLAEFVPPELRPSGRGAAGTLQPPAPARPADEPPVPAPAGVAVIRLANQPPGEPAASVGFVLDREGHVATAGIPDGEARVRVALGGEPADALVMARDEATDLAVLQAPAKAAPLPAGSSGALRAGGPARVLAPGPDGRIAAQTALVASVDTDEEGETTIRLTGLPPRIPAGAPVVDDRGQVVGVLRSSPAAPAEGEAVGARRRTDALSAAAEAIAIEDALPLLEQLKAGRAPRRGSLGLVLGRPSDDAARQAGLPASECASIEVVIPGGPAAAAGVRPGDILAALDGKPIAGPSSVARAARASAAGARAKLGLVRDGRRIEASLEVAEAPPPPASPPPAPRRRRGGVGGVAHPERRVF